MPYISGSSLSIALIKEGPGSQDVQEWLCKNTTWGTLIKILYVQDIEVAQVKFGR
jgi:hypothetical protein